LISVYARLNPNLNALAVGFIDGSIEINSAGLDETDSET